MRCSLFASSELSPSSTSPRSLSPLLTPYPLAPYPFNSRHVALRCWLVKKVLTQFFLFVFCLVLFSFFVVFVKNLRSVNEALKRAFNKFT